jgi:surfeit locus 1 family protein
MTDGRGTESWEPQIEAGPERPAKTGFPIGLTIATALALALLIGLGVWQLQRLKWKENLLAHVAALQTAKAQSIGPVLDALAQGRDVDLTRVKVVCPGLATAPFIEVYDLRNGEAGARLISSCAVESAAYRTILVDRGYIADSTKDRPAVTASDQTPIEVTGVLRKPDRGNFATPHNTPGHWYIRQVVPMAAALKAPQPAPMFLFAETPTNPAFKALVPAPLPVDIPNRHFEYALTWFSLAGALAFVYAATLFRRMRA